MTTQSRVKNTKHNIISGLVKQTVDIILPFIIRTSILYLLGTQYLGLNGLFTSVLQVLSLTDLGFSSAVLYILYKPVAENDKMAICAIMAYIKRVYFIIGAAMLLLGIAIMPFLTYFIAGDYPSEINIYALFIIYVISTSVSYMLYTYKSALLNAMQREYIVSRIYTITTLATKLCQAVLLLLFRNYYLFIIIMPIGTVANNLLVHFCSKKYFSELIPHGRITVKEKDELKKQTKAIFLNRVGDVARNSLDNIIISALLGLTAVAIYGNYYYIFSALYGITLMISNGMQASVGNSVVEESVEKNYSDFSKFTFIYSWLTGWITICMCSLYQPFMLIWMSGRANMLLPFGDILLICIYFYVITLNNIRNLYLNANGLYWECRTWYVVEAIANLLLNILLGYYAGITGIIIATIITVFMFNFVFRTNVLFKHYFVIPKSYFFRKHVFYFGITSINCLATYALSSLIPLGGVLGLGLKATVCIVAPNAIYFVAYFRTQEFKTSIRFIKELVII